ncbi:hypothetical protein I4U23_029249 [Adineta vaga]|nr:hypothetical protein I4U23_029249 [Adineta vaga]
MVTNISSETVFTDTDSIHHRHVHSTTSQDTNKHRRASIASVVHPDPLGVVLPVDEVTLKRHLGLFSGVCFIVGIIIGSGIFVSPKGVLRETQSVGLCLVIWMACGLVSLLGALCYAEIGTVIPRNGAEVAYMKEGIGSLHARTGDILAYLFSWTNTFILKPSSIAVLTLTFSQYFLSGIMDDCGPPEELVKMMAIFALLMLININSLSVSAANRLNIVFVICKVLTIMTVIIAGLVRIGQGHTQNLQNGFAGTTNKPFGVALAFYSGLWAYDGWNSLNSVTEELKNPKRNLWLSIVLALPFVMIFYLLTNISYFTVMNKAALLSSNAVAVTWGEVALGPAVRALPIFISISALGSANGSLFGAARYCMVSAQYGYLPQVFACIHTKRLTPIPGVVLQGLIAIAFCLPSNVDSLIDLFSFAAWIFYGLTFTATLCCKFTMKNADRVISVPLPLIVIIILISIYLVIAPLIASPNIGFLVAGVLILSGLLFYYPFVYRKIELNIITDTDSIHHRHVHSTTSQDTNKHRRASIASVVHPDPLGVVLPADEVTLKRHLGLFSGVCFIVGIIIGSGIFVSPKGVLRETQSVGLCLIVWAASGMISTLAALCFAEIGTVIPRNGAEIAYMKEGIGSVHERTGDILAYLFVWASTFIIKPSTVAVLALIFSQYFLSGIMNDCGPTEELVKLLAVLIILILVNINSISVSIANHLNIIFVICKVLTILTIVIAGFIRIGQGHTQNLKGGFIGTTNKPAGVALAFYKGLFAYGGWHALNSITEELKNPKRNLWLAISLALPSVTLLYVFINISYFTVMSKSELLSSNAVAVTWGETVLGPAVRALPILIAISALGSANGCLFEAARYCMVGAQYGYLPEIFACIHTQRLTPIPGVILQGLVALAFCIPSSIYALIDFFSFVCWIFYGLAFVATLCCKFTKKEAIRTINVPIPLIIIMILISIYLIIVPVISSPNIGFLVAGLTILFGLVFYYPFVYRRIELRFISEINSFLQVFFKLQRAQINI